MNEAIWTDATLNALCGDFTGLVDEMSLHTGHPGSTGANESGVSREGLSWTSPYDGLSSATASFTGITGDYPWVGLWGSSTFRGALRVNISNTAARDVTVMVTHEVDL